MKKSQSFNFWKFSVIFIPVLLVIILISACAAPAQAPAPSAPSAEDSAGAPPPVPAPAPPAEGRLPSTAPKSPGAQEAGPRYRPDGDTIGLSAGGAMDINNFRENIINGYLPLPTDMTYEGLFYNYYFDTGQSRPCDKLFCPSYSCAVTRDPFSNKTEYYLSVGLNSRLEERDFERKKLNLVIVLDISGSMSSPLNEYYYDSAGNQMRLDIRERNLAKIEVAKDAIIAIMDQLDYDDHFGIVLFNSRAHLLERMTSVSRTDMDEIEDSIYAIGPSGNTNLSDGMKLATELLDGYELNPYEYENRIIFLTDAMPNTGILGSYSLLRQLSRNADNNIYTTFVGIGVDFNTELVEDITKTRGANYYSVHSPRDFLQRMEEDFDYMVTPLVFDLRLTLDASGWDIEQVYGSPEADKARGDLMKVNTLFPSPKEEGKTRGGLILLKLKKKGSGWGSIKLKASYEDRGGYKDTSEARIYFEDARAEYFENSGIHKGVLLARYADLMKDWTIDEWEHAHWSKPWEPMVGEEDGIVIPPSNNLGRWERQSLPLTVSYEYRSLFRDFSDYFEYEMEEIGDYSLDQELELLESFSRFRY